MEKLISAPIRSKGMENALKRARQLTELEWLPLEGTVPGVGLLNGERIYYFYEKGKMQKGIPYSSVYEKNTYVGSSVSIETFISAACDPKSFLYTRNLRNECKEEKAAAFYGMVCSKFAQYAFDIIETYNTQHFFNIPGMELIAKQGEFCEKDFQRCDVLLNIKHTALITDILSDEKGNIKYIEVSEETSNPYMRRQSWTVDEFRKLFGGYDLYRYKYLDKVPYIKSAFVNVFDENAVLDDRKYDVLTRYGDKCNIKFKKDTPVILNILTDDWKKAVIYSGDNIVSELDVSGQKDFSFSATATGFYRVELKNGEKSSRPCYFCLYNTNVKVESSQKGTINVSYSSDTGTPCWAMIGSIGDSVYKKLNGSGSEAVTYTETISERKIKIAFENEYGVYLSGYAK